MESALKVKNNDDDKTKKNMTMKTIPRCSCCQKLSKHALVCSGCQINRYCDRICQKKDWREHKRLCVPMRDNDVVMKMMQKTSYKMIQSATITDMFKKHPDDILTLQYIGDDAHPSEDLIQREMIKAAKYANMSAAKCVLVMADSKLPQPSNVVQGVFRQDESIRKRHHVYIELRAWIGMQGDSLIAPTIVPKNQEEMIFE